MKQKIPKNCKNTFYESNKEKMAFACNAFSSNAVCFYFFLYSYGRNYIGI